MNDESATTAADYAYTDQKVANETSTRQSADQAEVQARQQGDANTLNAANQYTGQQVAGEALARQQGDAQTLTSANQHSDAAVNGEAAARMAADAEQHDAKGRQGSFEGAGEHARTGSPGHE